MRGLAALRLPSTWTAPLLDDVLAALRAALSGSGPALRPIAADAPDPFEPDSDGPIPLDGDADGPDDPTTAAVATSGSTGAAKLTLLQASALLASVSATHDHLGGAGHWVLALPAHHVAGLQVLLRSLVAGTRPVPLAPGPFRPGPFVDAVAALRGPRRYTSLVPTQLTRLLDDPDGTAALRALDAVLVGGAACPPALLTRARHAGVAVVTTYGMSETCGGCVYDGVPLPGVKIDLDRHGRIDIVGPVVARGYLPAGPGFGRDTAGSRRFATADRGVIDPDGRLRVLGRIDDVIVTGGENVDPAAVEAALHELDGVRAAVVVGVPDPQWGQTVVAGLVLAAGAPAPTLDDARALVGARLGRAAAPRRLEILDEIPLRGPGKPDRTAAAARLGHGQRTG